MESEGAGQHRPIRSAVMTTSYKLTTLEVNGSFWGLALAADGSHSISVGPRESRRVARQEIEHRILDGEGASVRKTMNYRAELPDLRKLCQ